MPQGELTMERSGVSKMLMVSGAVAAVAGGYYGVKFYKSRQEGLIRDFAYSMMLYWVSAQKLGNLTRKYLFTLNFSQGDVKASRDTVKEYQRKIGPIINIFHRSSCRPRSI